MAPRKRKPRPAELEDDEPPHELEDEDDDEGGYDEETPLFDPDEAGR